MKRTILSAAAICMAAMAWAQTGQDLVITDSEGATSRFPASELDMVIFQPAPDYINLPYFLGGSYEEQTLVGQYRLDFATEMPAENGLPANVGDVMMSLVLTGPWTDDIKAPELPEGYYRVGNGNDLYTFDAVRSAIYMRLAEGDINPMMIVDGTIDVRRDGNEYDIRIEVTTFEGLNEGFRYKGAIELPVGASEFEPFTEPLDIKFDGAQGRYYGNWFYPFSDDLSMQLWAGDLTADGYLKDGYILHLDFNEPKQEDYNVKNPRVADGVYTPENREAFAYTYLPYRFNKGAIIDFLGTPYINKTYIEYLGSDGTRKLGLLTGGSFTVSADGSKFEFDFTTEEGVSVKGTYTGVPNIQNFNDNDEKGPKRPFSTLTENRELSFKGDAIAMSYNDGPTILDDYNTLTLMVTVPAMNTGDYVQIDLLSKDEVVSDGTYTMTKTLGGNNMIPGTLDYGGQMLFSWYGDLDSYDPVEEYHTTLGCLATGTMVISTNDDGTKKIVFDLKDDAGYSITGEYNGPMVNLNDYQNKAMRSKALGAKNKAPRVRMPGPRK